MKKIILFASKDFGLKNDPKKLAEAIQARGAVVDIVYYEDVGFVIDNSDVRLFEKTNEIILGDCSLAIMIGWYKTDTKKIYRQIALCIALVCKKHGLEVWNSEVLCQRPAGKLSPMVCLALEGLAVPKTIYTANPQETAMFIENYLPSKELVVKANFASRGNDNHLVKSAQEAHEIANNKSLPSDYIIQQAIPNSGDYRVICVGGQPVMGIYRQRAADSKTHLNNVSQGATATKLSLKDIPNSVVELARRAANCLGREMGGVDILVDELTGKEYLLEVNPIPQLTTGSYIEDKLNMVADAVNNYLKEAK